jgi:hypothetical protein
LHFDASAEAGGRLDVGGGLPCVRDRASLLGESFGELRRGRDVRLDRGAPVGRE